MKILLTGKDGQVGFELNKSLISFGEIIAPRKRELDLLRPDDIEKFLDQVRPDIIINPAAYTAVDNAELEPETAYKINVIAPQILAKKAAQFDIPLIHFSTDYVFDGQKKNAYLETDLANPQSIYGKTKLEGELKVRKHFKHIILRTSWVFGVHGNNFLKTIIRLSQEKKELQVIDDQWGSPTSAKTLSYAIQKFLLNIPSMEPDIYGIYNITCSGETNWYLYTKKIISLLNLYGIKLTLDLKDIKPIKSFEYNQKVIRPLNCRLNTDKFKNIFMLELPNWEQEVEDCIRELIPIF